MRFLKVVERSIRNTVSQVNYNISIENHKTALSCDFQWELTSLFFFALYIILMLYLKSSLKCEIIYSMKILSDPKVIDC